MRAGDTAEEKHGLPFFQLCSSLVLLTGWASHSASEWQGCVLLLSMVSEEAVQSSAAQAGCRQGRGAENILILVKRSYLGQRLGCVPRGYKTTQGCFFFLFTDAVVSHDMSADLGGCFAGWFNPDIAFAIMTSIVSSISVGV